MLFDLNDLDNLNLVGARKIKKYDLETLKKIIDDNCVVLDKFIEFIRANSNKIENERTRRRILLSCDSCLETTSKKWHKLNELDLNDEFNKKSYNADIPFCASNPHCLFFQEKYMDIVSTYREIIEFMNRMYSFYKLSCRRNEADSRKIWEIFEMTKNVCSFLGIHCSIAHFREAIEEDPSIDLDDEISNLRQKMFGSLQIFVEDDVEKDIQFSSIPYTVSCPSISYDNATTFEMKILDPVPYIVYNRSYLKHDANLFR